MTFTLWFSELIYIAEDISFIFRPASYELAEKSWEGLTAAQIEKLMTIED